MGTPRPPGYRTTGWSGRTAPHERSPCRRADGPLNLLMDSTGITFPGDGGWQARKHGPPDRRDPDPRRPDEPLPRPRPRRDRPRRLTPAGKGEATPQARVLQQRRPGRRSRLFE